MDSSPAPGGHSRFSWFKTLPGIVTTGFAALALLITVGYLEENWRGDRIWDQTKAELEARGEILDRSKFVPPPVPDDQNFGALPYFQTTPDQRLRIIKDLASVTGHLPSSKDDADARILPYLGNWAKGQTVAPTDVAKMLETFLLHAHPGVKIPSGASPFDIFSEICPQLQELREAAASHPLCRFSFDYESKTPWNISLRATTDNIALAKLLGYDSELALLSHQPEAVIKDCRITRRIYAGLSQEPTLISLLFGNGVVANQLGVVEQGLVEHDWNDSQLAELDSLLSQFDCLGDSVHCLRGEAAFSTMPVVDACIHQRTLLLRAFANSFEEEDLLHLAGWEVSLIRIFYLEAPEGWLRINEADGMRRFFDGVRATDLATRRVYPSRMDAALQHGQTPLVEAMSFLSSYIPPMLNSIKKSAYLQVQVDMTRIACRLERYHLTHSNYPATLGALVPSYGTELPHDVMSGKPYMYRVDKDGSYTLYSIGWNEKDDGGDISIPGSSATYATDQSNDWVWFNHVIKKK